MNESISIIIPLYNKEKSIQKTVESILNQEYRFFELIIVDDGSTDSSLSKLYTFNDDRIKIYSKVNEGVSAARNFGLNKARYKYIFFLDADDLIMPTCLAIFVQNIKKFPNAYIYAANFQRSINGEIVLNKSLSEEVYIREPLKALWKNSITPRIGTILIKKYCFDEIGTFDSRISLFEDLDLILKLGKKYGIYYSPRVVLTYQCEYSNLRTKLVPLTKDYAYYAGLTNNKYENLIIAENIARSLIKRCIFKDWSSLLKLLNKHKGIIFFILYSFLVKKLKSKKVKK